MLGRNHVHLAAPKAKNSVSVRVLRRDLALALAQARTRFHARTGFLAFTQYLATNYGAFWPSYCGAHTSKSIAGLSEGRRYVSLENAGVAEEAGASDFHPRWPGSSTRPRGPTRQAQISRQKSRNLSKIFGPIFRRNLTGSDQSSTGNDLDFSARSRPSLTGS